MKPILLHGHERSLTSIKYNTEGDLLFSTSKDNSPCVWFSHNGELLGTFEGHNGAIWRCDPDFRSEHLLTGSADNTCKIWSIDRGSCVQTIPTKSAVRAVGWSYDAEQLFMVTDKTMGQKSELRIFNKKQALQEPEAAPQITIQSPASAKITCALWGPLDETILTGHDNGMLCRWDAKTGQELGRTESDHSDKINDMQMSQDLTMFITASKDQRAKLFDTQDLTHLKTYKHDRPVNSASISSLKDHIVMGGGQEAMSVTTTSAKAGKFDARFCHLVFEQELGRVKDHFGPINTVAFHPDGRSYSSGGEDGYIRVHVFDPTYFEFEFET